MANEKPRCHHERLSADLNNPEQRRAIYDTVGPEPALMITEGLLMYLPAAQQLQSARGRSHGARAVSRTGSATLRPAPSRRHLEATPRAWWGMYKPKIIWKANRFSRSYTARAGCPQHTAAISPTSPLPPSESER